MKKVKHESLKSNMSLEQTLWDKNSVKRLLYFRIEDLPTGLARSVEEFGGPELLLRRLLERPMSKEQEKLLQLFINHPGYDTNFYVEAVGVHYVSYSRALGKLAEKLAHFLNDGLLTQSVVRYEFDRVSPIKSEIPLNLPASWNSFVGRERELDSLYEPLSNKNVRLITLIGPGGTGKTRLSLQVVRVVYTSFPDGVFFIPLASLQDSNLIVPSILRELKINEKVGHTLLYQLKAYFHDKHILLILDNFEHLIDRAPLVTELLSSAPNLKILVTSRELLSVYGEYVVEITPMTLPSTASDMESIIQSEAVKLFVERAKAVSSFNLSRQNAFTIGEICKQLDGLPLAIELVAAQAKNLLPEEMLVRLTHKLDFVGGSFRDLPQRQQTLRGAIDWSYDLLNEREKIVFFHLAILADEFDVDIAHSVCQGIEGDIKDYIESLVNKSLLQRFIYQEGTNKYLFLETLREYGLEKLTESGYTESVWRQYIDYYVLLIKNTEPELDGPHSIVHLDLLERNFNHIRAIINKLLSNRDYSIVLEVLASLWKFWFHRSRIREGRALLDKALSLSKGMKVHTREKALFVAGNLAMNDLDFETGKAYLQEALPVVRKKSNMYLTGIILRTLGKIATQNKDYNVAETHLEESLIIFHTLNNQNEVAWTTNALATVAWEQGNVKVALDLYEQALQVFKIQRDQYGVAYSFLALGFLHYKRGTYVSAMNAFKEALTLCRLQGDKVNVAWLLQFLGYSSYQLKDFSKLFLFEEALGLYKELDRKPDIGSCFVGLAAMLYGQRKYKRCLHILGAADVLLKKFPNPELPLTASELNEIKEIAEMNLLPSEAKSAWNQGQGMSIEDTFQYIFSDVSYNK